MSCGVAIGKVAEGGVRRVQESYSLQPHRSCRGLWLLDWSCHKPSLGKQGHSSSGKNAEFANKEIAATKLALPYNNDEVTCISQLTFLATVPVSVTDDGLDATGAELERACRR